MDQTISSVEKSRQQFYDYLKKEDIDYVNARSKKVTVVLYRRKESAEDPWLQCFYFNEKESKKNSDKSSICFASSENLKNNQIADMISNCSGITDEEINYCKAAMRREARSRNLPDLSSKPDELRLLFLEYCEKVPENLKKQRRLYGEIVCNMMNFEKSLKDGFEVLNHLSKITIKADTTVDAATANVTKMRRMVQDFQTFADLVSENLCNVVEKFERYQELDEKMDRDLFNFLAHFFPNFLIPRNIRKRRNTST
ncbi:hypothetical protein AVEN_178116-1 [Araneus ventricosus]|uniref:Uncharacterized protein n=1 Tax=Araneus ventricosus TaxID=182803 RepID=A0A4Y2M6Y8_ARAVE|nr:hypothetical protein AVEN_178116-1 [Araneus ventricosus]